MAVCPSIRDLFLRITGVSRDGRVIDAGAGPVSSEARHRWWEGLARPRRGRCNSSGRRLGASTTIDSSSWTAMTSSQQTSAAPSGGWVCGR